MNLANDDRKLMIAKLNIDTKGSRPIKHELVVYLLECFRREAPDFFEREGRARADSANDRYAYTLLEEYIAEKHHVESHYVTLKNIKVVIFYEYVLGRIGDREPESKERNRKIAESREIYFFYKALISGKKCNLSKYAKAASAMEKLNWAGISQKGLDEDTYHGTHDILVTFIHDNYLLEFINEYNKYLPELEEK
jgi:hypothetical protein